MWLQLLILQRLSRVRELRAALGRSLSAGLVDTLRTMLRCLFVVMVVVTGCESPNTSLIDASPSSSRQPVAESASASASAPPRADSTQPSTPEPIRSPGDGFVEVASLTRGDDRAFLVTAWGDGFVALGWSGVAWFSPNGVDWTMTTTAGLAGTLYDVVELGDGSLLAIGGGPNPSLAGSLTTWTSADGVTWQAEDLGFDRNFILLDLAHGPHGYVMVGTQPSFEGPGAEQLWHSSDGRTWALTRSTTNGQIIHAVGAGPDGFVAVGQQGWLDGQLRAIVLASADGVEWIEAPADAGVLSEAYGLSTIAPIGGDWVTAPDNLDGEIDVLWSANGLDWEPRASFPVLTQIQPVLVGDGRRIFADVPYSRAPDLDADFVWSSTDAREWAATIVPISAEGARSATSGGVTIFLVEGRVFATDA